ncbi:MAG: hypothetical protein WCJ64_09080 [Rhodospirillaceae bacterium]
MVKPNRDGGIDLLDWGLGFISGIELAPRPWKKVTDPRQPGRALFEPILTQLPQCPKNNSHLSGG